MSSISSPRRPLHSSHLFQPLPRLHDFLFQPLAAGCHNCRVPSDPFLLLPKEGAEQPSDINSHTAQRWQMAAAAATRAVLQITKHSLQVRMKGSPASAPRIQVKFNTSFPQGLSNGKHHVGSLCEVAEQKLLHRSCFGPCVSALHLISL